MVHFFFAITASTRYGSVAITLQGRAFETCPYHFCLQFPPRNNFWTGLSVLIEHSHLRPV